MNWAEAKNILMIGGRITREGRGIIFKTCEGFREGTGTIEKSYYWGKLVSCRERDIGFVLNQEDVESEDWNVCVVNEQKCNVREK